MKLVVAILSTDDANKIQKALVANNFIFTRLATTSGFLRARNATFMIGVKEEYLPSLIGLIKENSKKRIMEVPNTIVNEFGTLSALPIKVEVGGATVFIIDVEAFHKM